MARRDPLERELDCFGHGSARPLRVGCGPTAARGGLELPDEPLPLVAGPLEAPEVVPALGVFQLLREVRKPPAVGSSRLPVELFARIAEPAHDAMDAVVAGPEWPLSVLPPHEIARMELTS